MEYGVRIFGLKIECISSLLYTTYLTVLFKLQPLFHYIYLYHVILPINIWLYIVINKKRRCYPTSKLCCRRLIIAVVPSIMPTLAPTFSMFPLFSASLFYNLSPFSLFLHPIVALHASKMSPHPTSKFFFTNAVEHFDEDAIWFLNQSPSENVGKMVSILASWPLSVQLRGGLHPYWSPSVLVR